MTAPAETRILADTGGLILSDDGRRVVVSDRRTGGPAVLAVVLGVLAPVLAGIGLVTLFIPTRPAMWVSLAFVVLGLALAAGTVTAVRTVRRRRSAPLNECPTVASLDRKLGLFSYPGSPVLAMADVRFERRGPALVAVSPHGTRVIKRGTPFGGGIGNADGVLNAVAQSAE